MKFVCITKHESIVTCSLSALIKTLFQRNVYISPANKLLIEIIH